VLVVAQALAAVVAVPVEAVPVFFIIMRRRKFHLSKGAAARILRAERV